MTEKTARAEDAAAPPEASATDQTPAAQQQGDAAALAAEFKDRLLRTLAEMENLRKRTEREVTDARLYGVASFARDLLGVADNLSRAITHVPPDAGDPAVKNFVLGIEMTEKELQAAFERNGLKRIAPGRGEKFDPHQHQAMAEAPGTDVAPGGIVEVMQDGYELLGRLVRPAMVVVAARGASAEPGQAEPAKPGAAGNPYAEGGEDEAGGSVDTRA
jgi:molecular chaperone GrpE